MWGPGYIEGRGNGWVEGRMSDFVGTSPWKRICRIWFGTEVLSYIFI